MFDEAALLRGLREFVSTNKKALDDYAKKEDETITQYGLGWFESSIFYADQLIMFIERGDFDYDGSRKN